MNNSGSGTALVSSPEQQSRREEAEKILAKIFQQPKNPQFIPHLIELMIRTNVWIDDPIFLLVGAVLGWEKLVSEAPENLEQKLKAWDESLEKRLADLDLTLVKKQEAVILEAAKELIKKQKSQEQLSLVKAVLPAGISVVLMFTIGIVTGGILTYWHFQRSIAPGAPRLMTRADANHLEWAKSKEGQLARDLMKWNRGWLDNRACEREAKYLGVTMQQNNLVAESGFCVIWTRAAKERKFKK